MIANSSMNISIRYGIVIPILITVNLALRSQKDQEACMVAANFEMKIKHCKLL